MSLEKSVQLRDRIIEIFNNYPDDEMFAEVLEIILEVVESSHGIFGYISETGNLVCPSMTRDVMEICQVSEKKIVFFRADWENIQAIWARSIIEGKTKYSNSAFKVPDGHIQIF